MTSSVFEHPPKNYSNLLDAFETYKVEVDGNDAVVTCPSCRSMFVVAHRVWRRTPRSITKPCPYCGELAKPE